MSLRARKRAARKDARAERGGGAGLRLGFGGGGAAPAPAPDAGPARAETDKIMDDLREFMETRGTAESAQGEVTVRWAYEIFAPVVAGAVLLVILIATA